MDREEAIKRLKWFKEYNEEDYCGAPMSINSTN